MSAIGRTLDLEGGAAVTIGRDRNDRERVRFTVLDAAGKVSSASLTREQAFEAGELLLALAVDTSPAPVSHGVQNPIDAPVDEQLAALNALPEGVL